jgi:phosphonate transport system permease protein
MTSANVASPALRDPAWSGRLFWTLAAAVLLWPLLVATEFRPWILFEARNLQVTGDFLASFLPPAVGSEFLGMVVKETWRTVAIATAGMTLALVVAVPLTLACTRVLSVSGWCGRWSSCGWWAWGPRRACWPLR